MTDWFVYMLTQHAGRASRYPRSPVLSLKPAQPCNPEDAPIVGNDRRTSLAGRSQAHPEFIALVVALLLTHGDVSLMEIQSFGSIVLWSAH